MSVEVISDDKWSYYTIQHITTHQGEWLKLDSPLNYVEDKNDWKFSSWDVFGNQVEPWTGTGNDYKPEFKKSHDQTHEVWSKTGSRGWWSLKYAILGLKRLEKAQSIGKFNYGDGYGNPTLVVRYRFRIVKVVGSSKVATISLDDALDEIIA